MYTCIYIILYWLVASPRQHAAFGIIRNLLLHPCSGFHFKITLPRVIPTVANILPITFYHTIWHFIWQNILTYYLKSSMTLYLAFYLEFHLTFTLTYFRIFWRLSSILSAILSDIRFGSGSPHRAHELAIGFGSGKPQRADKLAVQYLSGAGVCVCTPLLHRAWCLLSFIQTWQTTRGLRFAGGQACHIQPGQRSWDVIGEASKDALTCTCTFRLQTVEQVFLLLCFCSRDPVSSPRLDRNGMEPIQCVCVWNVWTDVKLRWQLNCIYDIFYYSKGSRGSRGARWSTKTPPATRVNVPAGLWWCTWAHLSRSWWPP